MDVRANLSNDYFTNRQDRYHCFSSKRITDYFARIHHAVGSLSYSVQPDSNDSRGYLLQWPSSNAAPSPLDDPRAFKASATALLKPLLRPSIYPQPSPANADTVVYPVAQFTPLLEPDTSSELPSLLTLLRALSSPAFATSRWMFTAGYFNIHPQLSTLLIASSSQQGTVVTASPWANGFYGSKGVSGMLPAAYTLLSRRFLEKVKAGGRQESITLKEWRRGTVGQKDGWTYHAKGLWITMPMERHPSITLVGSSNYTTRSYTLDLEINALVMTRNEDLQKRLADEQTWLQEYSRPVGLDEFARTERRVGLHVRVAMWIVTLLGGAL